MNLKNNAEITYYAFKHNLVESCMINKMRTVKIIKRFIYCINSYWHTPNAHWNYYLNYSANIT